MKLLLPLLLLITTLAHAQLYTVTAYCNNHGKGCPICCGKNCKLNQTASGKAPVQGITCAAPKSFPFGTHIYIEGVGVRIVQDRCAWRYRHFIDVYFDDHTNAVNFGRQQLNITKLNK